VAPYDIFDLISPGVKPRFKKIKTNKQKTKQKQNKNEKAFYGHFFTVLSWSSFEGEGS